MRPVVTFTPSWNKILSGDSITMTCDMDDAMEGSVTYTWYKNNGWIHTGNNFTIQSAITRHSGDYQCGTSEDNISEAVTLNVTEGPVILQSPPYIYEGDDLSLRCHSRSRDTQGPIEFYRNNEIIYSSNNDSEIQFRNHRDETAVYKCRRQVLTTDYSVYSDETDVTAQGDSSSSRITFSPNWKKIFTGESMTMTCNVNHYKLYSWYKDKKLLKQTDQNFIVIHSAQISDSGKYQCRTSSGNSPEARLDVSDGPVILQAPLYVYYGYILDLRCHSLPEYSLGRTRFYKDDKLFQDLGHEWLYIRGEDMAGRYRCEKILVVYNPVPYMDSVSVPIRDLFSTPEIKLTRSVTTEGDHLTRSVTTEGDNLTRSVTTEGGSLTRSVTTEGGSLTWSVTTEGDNLTRSVTTEGDHLARSVTTEGGSLTWSVTTEGDHLTWSVTTEGDHLTRSVTTEGDHLTRSVTTEGGSLTWSVTTEGDHLTRSVTTEGDHLTRSVTTEGGHLTRSVTTEGDNLTRSVTTEGGHLTRSVTTEGDHLTLTCDTRLSPYRRTTELLYAFYRDGQEVQGFSPSNKYEVLSAKLEDSGNYSCTARTLDNKVWKTSQELHVQIQSEGRENRNLMQINIIRLIVSGLIVIMGCAILSHHLYEVCRSQEGSQENDYFAF